MDSQRSIRTRLLSFVESEDRSAWIRHGPISAYFRKACRAFLRPDGTIAVAPTLDLADITVSERYRGKGRGGRVLDDLEHVARECRRATFVESVASEILQGMLLRRGYERCLPISIVPSYVKMGEAAMETSFLPEATEVAAPSASGPNSR